MFNKLKKKRNWNRRDAKYLYLYLDINCLRGGVLYFQYCVMWNYKKTRLDWLITLVLGRKKKIPILRKTLKWHDPFVCIPVWPKQERGQTSFFFSIVFYTKSNIQLSYYKTVILVDSKLVCYVCFYLRVQTTSSYCFGKYLVSELLTKAKLVYFNEFHSPYPWFFRSITANC